MQIVCRGCQHETRCRDQKMVCLAYLRRGERGDNPSKAYYQRMVGNDVDKTNERLARFERLHAQNKKSIADIHHWIMSNVRAERIKELTLPDGIKAPLMGLLWRHFGDRVELRDFV